MYNNEFLNFFFILSEKVEHATLGVMHVSAWNYYEPKYIKIFIQKKVINN